MSKPNPLCLNWNDLNTKIINCHRCPRLVHYRENVPPRASFKEQTYWRKPLPGFGDPNARLLLTGLAPAAHGGNRTGRIFTGDESGKFLFNALYKTGFANQPTSEFVGDGLQLHDCYITAAVKCAPPENKPTKEEFHNCSGYYENELFLLKNLQCLLALGKLAFDAYLAYAKTKGSSVKGIQFSHGARFEIEGLPVLYASYHPSQQNTFTKLLTPEMLIDLLHQIKTDL